MVHLSPATVDEFENSCRANVQRLHRFAIMVGAAFPPHGPKHLPGTMNRIVPEFDVNVRRALEDPLIHLVRLIRSAPDPAERVINRDFIGLTEIIVDHLQVACVERAVKLRQRLLRLAEVSKILSTRNGSLNRLQDLRPRRLNGYRQQGNMGCHRTSLPWSGFYDTIPPTWYPPLPGMA